MVDTYDLVRTILCDFKQAPRVPSRQPAWIKRQFARYGEVVDFKMRKDKKFFWIKFKSPDSAANAARARKLILDGGEGIIYIKKKTNLNDDLLRVVRIPKLDMESIAQQINDVSDDFEEQLEHFKNMILLTTTDLQRREALIRRLERMCRRIIPDAQLLPFGSSASGLGFVDSDIDIFLRSNRLKNWLERPTYEYAMSKLSEISEVIRQELHMYTQPIPSVRCPIIKIEFSNDFELKPHEGIAVDLNLTNPWGVCNTQLIAILTELEPRFQDLAVVLRCWAKNMNYLGPRFMSSYAFTLLVIFFCQVHSPPLLPPIKLLQDLAPAREIMSYGWNCAFSRDLDAIRAQFHQPEEDLPVGQLVCDFFAYYSKLDYQHKYLDLLNGRTQWKYNIPEEIESEFWGKNASHLCAQDPFELNRNVLSNLRGEQNDEFFNTIRNAANWTPLVIVKPQAASSSGYYSSRSDLDMVMEELGSESSDSDEVCIIEKPGSAKSSSSGQTTVDSVGVKGLAKFLLTQQSPSELRLSKSLSNTPGTPSGENSTGNSFGISWQDNTWMPMTTDGFATVMRRQNYQREQAIRSWVNALVKAIEKLCVDILDLDEFNWIGKWDVIDGRRNLFAEFTAIVRSDSFKHLLRRGTVMEQYACELDQCFSRLAAEQSITKYIMDEDALEKAKEEAEARQAVAEGRRVKPSKAKLAQDRLTYTPFSLRVSCVMDCRYDLPQVGMYKLESKGEDLGLANYFRISLIKLSEEFVEDLDLPFMNQSHNKSNNQTENWDNTQSTVSIESLDNKRDHSDSDDADEDDDAVKVIQTEDDDTDMRSVSQQSQSASTSTSVPNRITKLHYYKAAEDDDDDENEEEIPLNNSFGILDQLDEQDGGQEVIFIDSDSSEDMEN